MGMLTIHPDAATAAARLADALEAELRGAERRRGRVVWALPTGRTVLPLYEELLRRHREEGLSFARAVVFHLDELWPTPPGGGFGAFLRERLLGSADFREENLHFLEGAADEAACQAACSEYEARIRSVGGLGHVVLGVGINGHLAYNEPGSSPDSRTRLVRLLPSSRLAAGAMDPAWQDVRHALTLGLGTILAARRVSVLATGEAKAAVVAAALQSRPYADLPASWLQRHPAVTWYLDEAAAAVIATRPAPR